MACLLMIGISLMFMIVCYGLGFSGQGGGFPNDYRGNGGDAADPSVGSIRNLPPSLFS
jgi:hypothetical protein